MIQGATGSGAEPDSILNDKQERRIRYLRLAVTQRCNLRCAYCMPESGVPWIPHDEILRFEEMELLVRLFVSMGIEKVRLTGGEPFVRKGLIEFLDRLIPILPAERLFITTNGVDTHRHLETLAAMGIGGINLSLDSLDPIRYAQIARRDRFQDAYKTLEKSVFLNIPLKVNMVVLGGINDHEIPRFVDMARNLPIQVRFIEQMEFNGKSIVRCERVDAEVICERVSQAAGAALHWRQQGTSSVSSIPGWNGSVGIIASRKRSFCGSCTRIRITPTGGLQTCLYGGKVLDLREMIRSGAGDETIRAAIRKACWNRFPDGHRAEKYNEQTHCSMATIGG